MREKFSLFYRTARSNENTQRVQPAKHCFNTFFCLTKARVGFSRVSRSSWGDLHVRWTSWLVVPTRASLSVGGRWMSSLNSGPAKKEALPPTRVEAFEKIALSFWAASPTMRCGGFSSRPEWRYQYVSFWWFVCCVFFFLVMVRLLCMDSFRWWFCTSFFL